MKRNKLYILAYDSVFTWRHLYESPAKWIIKLATGFKKYRFNYNHISYNYDYAHGQKYINQAIGTGFEFVHYKLHCEKRYSKIWAYEIKGDIDFALIHKMTEDQTGADYEVDEANYSAIDKVPILNKVYRYFFKIKKNDKSFSFCSKAGYLILRTVSRNNRYVLDKEDDNSINPNELIELIEKYDLSYSKILVWDKNHFVNNIFENA